MGGDGLWDLKCGWAAEPLEDVLARAVGHRVGGGEPQPGAPAARARRKLPLRGQRAGRRRRQPPGSVYQPLQRG